MIVILAVRQKAQIMGKPKNLTQKKRKEEKFKKKVHTN